MVFGRCRGRDKGEGEGSRALDGGWWASRAFARRDEMGGEVGVLGSGKCSVGASVDWKKSNRRLVSR